MREYSQYVFALPPNLAAGDFAGARTPTSSVKNWSRGWLTTTAMLYYGPNRPADLACRVLPEVEDGSTHFRIIFYNGNFAPVASSISFCNSSAAFCKGVGAFAGMKIVLYLSTAQSVRNQPIFPPRRST
jgi:hypothetical protein